MHFQTFRGTLAAGAHSTRVTFKARIGKDGEVEISFNRLRITSRNRFIRDHWSDDKDGTPEFRLTGSASHGLTFETDSLTFNSLGERSSGSRHTWKPSGRSGKVLFVQRLGATAGGPLIKLSLKGFECFPRLSSTCHLGDVSVAGATKMADPDRLTGWIEIKAAEQPPDVSAWRDEATKLLEHVRRILSFAASTLLQAPVLEFAFVDRHEVEVLSQSRQHEPGMRVFHKINQQAALDAAMRSYFTPPIEATNLFFAIEWFTMASIYNEVRLVNAMTALENLIDSNLMEDESLIQPPKQFQKTRRVLRQVIGRCFDAWPTDRADEVRLELSEKLGDLNRRAFRRKLYLLAARWRVPLDGISEERIQQVIAARNLIVHRGYHSLSETGSGLWDHMTVARELVVRFLLTAIGYRGRYLSHLGGHHFAEFPPSGAASPTTS